MAQNPLPPLNDSLVSFSPTKLSSNEALNDGEKRCTSPLTLPTDSSPLFFSDSPFGKDWLASPTDPASLDDYKKIIGQYQTNATTLAIIKYKFDNITNEYNNTQAKFREATRRRHSLEDEIYATQHIINDMKIEANGKLNASVSRNIRCERRTLTNLKADLRAVQVVITSLHDKMMLFNSQRFKQNKLFFKTKKAFERLRSTFTAENDLIHLDPTHELKVQYDAVVNTYNKYVKLF